MSVETTVIFSQKTGTNWTQDVTNLNLSASLSTKDFVVTNMDTKSVLDNSDFTKTSQTVLTYSGSALDPDTNLRFARITTVTQRRYQIGSGSFLSSSLLNEELDTIYKRFNEIGTEESAGLPTIINQDYSSAWATDTFSSRVAKNIYDKMESVVSDVDTNASNISTNTSNIDLKANINSPTFTGTPAAPTAAPSTDTTQIATTAFVQAAIDSAVAATKEAVYPVGSIYTNSVNSTNPATLLGFGTWVAFGAGRVMVGFDGDDLDFDDAEKVGGEKAHALTAEENGPHTHVQNRSSIFQGGGGNAAARGDMSGDNTTEMESSGSGTPHNNLQPYITVYMWKRTA